LKRRDYGALMADIRRLRPVIVVALVIVVLLPSLDEMATQNLSPLTVLVRLTEGLAFIGTLVWLVSAVVIHYARIQVEAQRVEDQEGGTRA
jgi:hypothetical protein